MCISTKNKHGSAVISVGVWATKGEGEEAVLCCKYCDLTDFNYFTRGKVEAIFALRTFVVLVSLPRLMRRTRHHLQEFDTFVSRTVVCLLYTSPSPRDS